MGVIVVGLRNDFQIEIESDDSSSITVGGEKVNVQSAGPYMAADSVADHLRVHGKNSDGVFHCAQWAYVLHRRNSAPDPSVIK